MRAKTTGAAHGQGLVGEWPSAGCRAEPLPVMTNLVPTITCLVPAMTSLVPEWRGQGEGTYRGLDRSAW